MSRSLRFAFGEYYHLYNRGTDRRTIFLDDKDYQRFVKLLYVSNAARVIQVSDHADKNLADVLVLDRGETIVDIGGYCLMPNHFHLLIREKQDGGITEFMHKLGTAFTMYFNQRRQRRGSLFEGTFGARHADSDRYLKYLFAYIHLNPVKLVEPLWRERGIRNIASAEKFLRRYFYSSFLDYAGASRPEGSIINRTVFPNYFVDSGVEFVNFIQDWLSYGDAGNVKA